MDRKILKQDKYRKARGGHSRILELACASCGAYIVTYQKDGPGILKRLYLDRISKPEKWSGLEKMFLKKVPKLECGKCQQLLGVPYIYEKEARSAFRLFAGAVAKKFKK